MREDHPWFTARAATMWRARPARSILAMVPAGCDESGVGAYLARWLPQHFRPPEECAGLAVAVARVVPDTVTSCAGFLSQLAKEFGLTADERAALRMESEPSEILQEIIDTVHAHGRYPVAVIERFHSFAHVADDSLLSMLSRMRSLEQSSTMTTIAISPLGYGDLRRAMSSSLPFVNSSYGDNHDQAVMSPLNLEEFSRYGLPYGISSRDLSALFRYGGGPDAIFQAILDEGGSGSDDFVDRCARRAKFAVERFLSCAIGPIDDHFALLNRIQNGTQNREDVSYIESIPQREFIFDSANSALRISPVLASAIRIILDDRDIGAVNSQDSEDSTRVLLISANSIDAPLDIEDEIRAMHREIDGTAAARKIVITNCHAATPDDVVRYLRKHTPQIVHFSGHGSTAGLYLRNEGGGEIEVPGAALASTFKGRSVRLAVFNVCSSHTYAAQVAHHVEAVICTTESVGDVAAKRFSAAFYRTIGDGFSVDEAFRDACNAVELYDLESVFELFGDGSVKLV